jgi:peptidylprolyl isomerase domain and WD repeat-containing protein 1
MSDDESSSSDDDDLGPQPVTSSLKRAAPANEKTTPTSNAPPEKKKARRFLPNESTYLSALPSSQMYEKSYMHRDVVRFVFVSSSTDFFISVSVDGVVKFWKKFESTIEFVKQYRAHLACPSGAALSLDGRLFVTTSASERRIKLFDVVSFDMVQVVQTTFPPGVCCWAHGPGATVTTLAVAGGGGGQPPAADFSIRLYHGEVGGGLAFSKGPFATVSGHVSRVRAIAYNPVAKVGVSVDEKGMIEYWSPGNGAFPKRRVKFKYTSGTDLVALLKAKATPYSMVVSPDGKHFVVLSSDQQVRLFSFYSGKLKRQYDERARRVSSDEMHSWATAAFDESSKFLIFPSARGLKVVNTVTNTVARHLGEVEDTEHFLGCALYQGIPQVSTQSKVKRAAKEGKVVDRKALVAVPDPTLVCTSLGKQRFYLFSTREPEGADRDVYNEKPTGAKGKEGGVVVGGVVGGAASGDGAAPPPGSATIHTSMGDIAVQLYPTKTPLTVKNWMGLAGKGYYDNVVFHRVIKNFMLQTGDPTGTGRGGDSVWGGKFQDEFVPTLKHDRPGILSMANAGPGTNGSQFFITVAATPWLDGKHTVFGRVVSGMNVVSAIENCPCDRSDRPLTTIKILSVSTG